MIGDGTAFNWVLAWLGGHLHPASYEAYDCSGRIPITIPLYTSVRATVTKGVWESWRRLLFTVKVTRRRDSVFY